MKLVALSQQLIGQVILNFTVKY